MIYLLAILWFASGFMGVVYYWTGLGFDFKLFSIEFVLAILTGLIAPAGWIAVLVGLVESGKLPKITLFKARKHD